MESANNKAILLCRVSSEKQASGYSMDYQERNGKEYAERLKLILNEEGIFRIIESSYHTDRKKWIKFVERAKRGDETHILIPKVDRCFRNFFDMAQIADIPQRYNKVFHYFDDGLIHHRESPASDILRLGIQGVVATWYAIDLAQKTKRGLLEKCRQGYWPTRAPVGYVNDKLNKKIVIDESLKMWVVRIYELAAKECSLEEISRTLTKEGCLRKFSRSYIGYMIRNPVYSGWIAWPKNGTRIQGRHQPIVTQQMQDAAIRGLERFERPKYNQHAYTYQGLIRCGECCCSVVGEMKKGKFMYWHCTWRPAVSKQNVSETGGDRPTIF